MKTIKELFSFGIDSNFNDTEISDFSDNSKQIIPGCLFVALNRNVENRKEHIKEALAGGAKCILQRSNNGKNYTKEKGGIIWRFSNNVRKELAYLASKFFDRKFSNVVAVTGTNGKTSTVDILRQIWLNAGISAASIGTLGVITENGQEELRNNLTSPDCLELNRILQRLTEKKIVNVAIETTSQGLDQHRVDEIEFSICAFTNFSQDHLDYHKTFENYWLAKSRLFSELATPKSVFVVNSDDAYSEKICEIANARGIKCVSYGYQSNDVKILKVDCRGRFREITVSFFGKEILMAFPLRGAFQIYNSLCAATIGYFSGLTLEQIIDGLKKLRPIDGRMELVASFGSANVYIDYAHTPDALRTAILSTRDQTLDRVIVVFGCGGNRDQKKRKIMGEIAANFADEVIVTDDNPREEDPKLIRKMILEGCPRAIEIASRKEAIKTAIGILGKGDTLLVAGKGHESYQLVGKESMKFSDREVIRNAVRKK
ncbi:MAG: UDP-N-acetylmuramoyl-L-alanyl-D-glutamate--2,6-diaminopimelate ligase [Holosporaceae bacterium]|jgi:UDP-N-acetylmuramoyl-L-alanyl-D-glutamate--2,6-diaminopimelate ligase|nr:UDP-N-acetylmuramoyl-L-alanyl-D-glutamate--2,6-diaminopimelate ligase [Holosporaceae bacterium]